MHCLRLLDVSPTRNPHLPAVYAIPDGAAGDGKTDDTASFQAAIDAAYKASGGIVYAPTGQYVLDGSLQLRSGVTLEGTYRGPTAHTGDRTPGQLLPPMAPSCCPRAARATPTGRR